MKITALIKWMGLAIMAISLVACETPPPPPPPPESEPAPVFRANTIDSSEISKYSTAIERIFAEGLDFYDKGDYDAAIKKFQSPEFAKSWPELQVRALKYLAFSYCVTDQLQACEKAFRDAIQTNPRFKLLPSEEGHPIWGPVFQKARSEPPNQTEPVKPDSQQVK